MRLALPPTPCLAADADPLVFGLLPSSLSHPTAESLSSYSAESRV